MPYKDNVRVKTFLLIHYVDIVVHSKCWNKLKIPEEKMVNNNMFDFPG